MSNVLTIGIDGQVVNSDQDVLDTISRKVYPLTQADDQIWRDTITADNVTENDLTIPQTNPGYVLVTNRDGTNDLLIGPNVAGSLARFIEVPPGKIALFPIDATATLRYKSLGAPVVFDVRAWSL